MSKEVPRAMNFAIYIGVNDTDASLFYTKMFILKVAGTSRTKRNVN